MNKKLFFPSILSLIVFVAPMMCASLFPCSSTNIKNKCAEDTIFVSYFIPEIDNSVRITCKMMSSYSHKLKTEEIIHLDDEEFKKIQYLLALNAQMMLDKECDARLIIETDSFKMCIGNFADLSKKTEYPFESTIYFIKSKSGYYNCKKSEELADDRHIMKFGIPLDYVYQEYRPQNQLQIKIMRKIAFIKNK